MSIWERGVESANLQPPHNWSDGELRRALVFGVTLFWVIIVTLLLY